MKICAFVDGKVYVCPTHIQSYVENYVVHTLAHEDYYSLGEEQDIDGEERIEVTLDELKKANPGGFRD